MEPDFGSWQTPDISRSHLYRGTIAWTPPTAIYRAYTVLTSGIWEKSNNNMIKYHPTNHKITVYSNKMKKFGMWTLPWQALWQLPLHIITAQAVAVGCVWCSWWQFSTFQCRIASLWIIWLRGYRDMDRIDIGIEMWYQYWYRYRKICNDMQP